MPHCTLPNKQRSIYSNVLSGLLLSCILLCSAVAANAQRPPNSQLPGLGDSPADAGPIASDLSPAFKKKEVTRALRKVADWQLDRVREHYSLDWTFAALYAGFMAVPSSVNGSTYQNAMRDMGKQLDRKSTRLNSSHSDLSRMPSSA